MKSTGMESQQVLRTEVVIVGAGPTGLSMAVQLLRYNIDFIILEKNEKTTPLSKALVVQARSLEIFQEIGLAEKAIKEGQITTGLNMFYKSKLRAKVNINKLGEGLSQFPYALSLEQSKTETLLVDYLKENNRTIRWKSEFKGYEQVDNRVIVSFNDETGQERKIEAQYPVGCDGASSMVRHKMGLELKGDTVPRMFYVADVKLRSSVINKNELFMFLFKKGFIIFFPMEGEGHYRIVGILPDADESKEYKFEDIEPSIKHQIGVSVDFEELGWFSSYKVHSRKTDSFGNERSYIAGDAAHIHTPAGGQGMNTGIQDVYNLAWKLAFVIKGELNPEFLKTYSIERAENAKNLLETTDKLFDAMAGENGFWNFIRLNILPVIVHLVTQNPIAKKWIFPLISETGIRYKENELIIGSTIKKVKAGNRMPYFTFPQGDNIFDYLREPAFKLLFFGQNKQVELNTGKIKTVKHSFQYIPKALFGNHADFYILLRPDNHISYIGKDIRQCRDLFSRLNT
ncbi:MAG TPA: FAD-dependent monooxygenase [Bacteroidia bacterium]|nr:FAD-dependent monooxygenase [Bacteroidia bacterium]